MKHDWKIIWVTPKLIHISPPLNIILKKLPANSSILDFPQEKKKRTYSKKDLRWLLDEKAFTSLYNTKQVFPPSFFLFLSFFNERRRRRLFQWDQAYQDSMEQRRRRLFQ